MQVHAILEDKGAQVRTVDASATVAIAVADMAGFGIGALVVVEGGQPIGLISERDVLSRVVAVGRDPGDVRVSDVMCGGPVSVAPDATLEQALDRMRDERCRHLLVLRNDRMCGLISMGDITRRLVREREAQIGDLMLYITHG